MQNNFIHNLFKKKKKLEKEEEENKRWQSN